MTTTGDRDDELTITGYCDRLSAVAGDVVQLKVSTHVPGPCELALVRVISGDPSSRGPGFLEEEVSGTDLPSSFEGVEQPIRPGSWALTTSRTSAGVLGGNTITLAVHVWPTAPAGGREQSLINAGNPISDDDMALFLSAEGHLGVRIRSGSDVVELVGSRPITERRWARVTAVYDAVNGELRLDVVPDRSFSPGFDLLDPAIADRATVATGLLADVGLRVVTMAASLGDDGSATGHYNGKLSRPSVSTTTDGEASEFAWDFAGDPASRTVVETSGSGFDLTLDQLPARAVTGPLWDGSSQRWSERPDHYDAIHFHSDDLYDAEWDVTATLTVPDDLPSGIYAFRSTGPTGSIDRSPFVVRPAPHHQRSAVAFLLPTATYMAYANHRMTIDGSDFFEAAAESRLRPHGRYIRSHPEIGLSHYEYHPDGSGVMFSSQHRPILNMKPGADGWGFTPDTGINAFLEQSGVPFDVITDHDVHAEGAELLSQYRVVVTGSHPEYWSTDMLDGLEGFLRSGGRMMYLGGNGFYWRVAFTDEWPGAMEVRRAEDGTRAWIAEPGEYYHAFGGEYGGLWRRLGRAPNRLVGVGFAAQGFDRASHYRRSEASRSSRAAWIFDGVESDEIVGDYGVGGGAAGQEIDRFDARLGSPPHAVILATSEEHSDQMLRTKEEYHATVIPRLDHNVRADMVFFETPESGAVFSVGSISWFGALAHQGYDNDIARITTNVLVRFADEEPFDVPPPATAT